MSDWLYQTFTDRLLEQSVTGFLVWDDRELRSWERAWSWLMTRLGREWDPRVIYVGQEWPGSIQVELR